MAKGENAEKDGYAGLEYWSGRPGKYVSISKVNGNKKAKRNTHKSERKQAKQQILEQER